MKLVFSFLLLFSLSIADIQAQDLNDLRDLSNMIANNDDRREVIKKATKFIKKDNTVSEVFEIRARAYEWLDKEKCVADFQMAIQLDSTNVNAHNGLGNILSDLERYEEALEHYELALKHGGYIGILLNVANLYEEISDYEGWERTALRLASPEMDGFNRQMGFFSMARLHKSKNEIEIAANYYIKGCGIGDVDGYFLLQTALLLIDLEKTDEACSYLERAKSAHDYEYDCCPDVPELMETHCSK